MARNRERSCEGKASLFSFYPADLDSFGRTANQPVGPLSNARIFIRFLATNAVPDAKKHRHRSRHESSTIPFGRPESQKILETIANTPVTFLRDRTFCSRQEKELVPLLSDSPFIMQRNDVWILLGLSLTSQRLIYPYRISREID